MKNLFVNFHFILKQVKHQYRANKLQKKIKETRILATQRKLISIYVAEFIPFWSECWGEKEGMSDELEENLQRFIFWVYLTTAVDFQFKLSGK